MSKRFPLTLTLSSKVVLPNSVGEKTLSKHVRTTTKNSHEAPQVLAQKVCNCPCGRIPSSHPRPHLTDTSSSSSNKRFAAFNSSTCGTEPRMVCRHTWSGAVKPAGRKRWELFYGKKRGNKKAPKRIQLEPKKKTCRLRFDLKGECALVGLKQKMH